MEPVRIVLWLFLGVVENSPWEIPRTEDIGSMAAGNQVRQGILFWVVYKLDHRTSHNELFLMLEGVYEQC